METNAGKPAATEPSKPSRSAPAGKARLPATSKAGVRLPTRCWPDLTDPLDGVLETKMPSSIRGWASARRSSSSSARSTSRSDSVGLQVTSAEDGAGWLAGLEAACPVALTGGARGIATAETTATVAPRLGTDVDTTMVPDVGRHVGSVSRSPSSRLSARCFIGARAPELTGVWASLVRRWRTTRQPVQQPASDRFLARGTVAVADPPSPVPAVAPAGGAEQSFRELEEMVNGMEARDAEAAEKAVHAHFDAVIDVLSHESEDVWRICANGSRDGLVTAPP